jgi:hypothetical protein
MDLNLIVATEIKRRLIVLVPEGLDCNSLLAQNIYQIALSDHCDVLYLAFVSDEDNRLMVSRNLATLKAMTVAETVAVSSKIVQPENWLAVLREVYRPGDQIVCHARHGIKKGAFRTILVHDMLLREFTGSIITFSGMYHPWQALSKKWLNGLIFWLGCLLILAGFGFLEVQVDRGLQGFTRTALLLVMWTLEVGTFLAWNRVPKI